MNIIISIVYVNILVLLQTANELKWYSININTVTLTCYRVIYFFSRTILTNEYFLYFIITNERFEFISSL